MLPFKIFNQQTKTTWVIINYHPSSKGGTYLAAREDDSQQDGELTLLSVEDVVGCRMLEFIESQELDE